MLFTTRLVKVPSGSPRFGGELVNSIIVSFEKAGEDKLYLRVVTNVAVADSANAIAKAVRNSTVDPIVMVMDVKARGKENKSSIVDVTDFILKDNNITGFDAESKKSMYLGGVAPERSSILAVTAYPQNIEIRTMKTFSVGGGMPAAGGEAQVSPSVGVTMELSSSVMLLPEKPMAARYSDNRMGYHSENYKVFSDTQQKVEEKEFIVRYRLEPKPEDIEKYKRGELVEPKEPLIYYVDPSTPKQWVSYIMAGINDWNEAFKAAGYKNAIIGREWPANDSTMSLEDVRYKVVRYFPTEQGFSYSPRIYDPRSGEILQSYVGWSHNKMQALHDWYFVQAAATDSRARNIKFSTELMGSLIRSAIATEIGHSLGLRTNMAGSSAIPVEKLRDNKWLQTNGISASIMDVLHYNYVAQPGDNVSPNGLIPRIGEYDKWAIKYGYAYTGSTDFEEDKKVVQKWLIDALSANPRLKFGIDINPNLNNPADPSTQTEDLGDDRIKAAGYGIKNLKIVTANLLAWTKEDMDRYDKPAMMYENICEWYRILSRTVYTEIGGVYENLKSVEQAGDIYAPVPRKTQKQAVEFLQTEVFQTPTWLLDQQLLNKFRKPAKKELVQRYAEDALYHAISSDRLFKMYTETMRFGRENTYTIDELLTDINAGLWSELRATHPVVIDSYRRLLQKSSVEYLSTVLREAAKSPEAGSTASDLSITDIPVVIRVHLDKVMQQCKAAMPACKDVMTLAHLKYVAAKIDHILNPKY